MLIERIIELQLRVWAPWRTGTPITGYFHDKTKIPKENLRVDYYSLLQMQPETMHLTSSYMDQITNN